MALNFSLALSTYIRIVEDMVTLFIKSAFAWFRIVEGELDKFKIDPQTGEVSTIQVSLC